MFAGCHLNISCHFPGTHWIWWHLQLSCFWTIVLKLFCMSCHKSKQVMLSRWMMCNSQFRPQWPICRLNGYHCYCLLGFFTLWQMHDAAWCKQVAINIEVFKNVIHIAIHKDFLRISSHGSALYNSLQHFVGKILLWIPCYPMSKGPNPTPIGQSPAIHLGMM